MSLREEIVALLQGGPHGETSISKEMVPPEIKTLRADVERLQSAVVRLAEAIDKRSYET